MYNARYQYNSREKANALHEIYRGTWSEAINNRLDSHYKDIWQNILKQYPGADQRYIDRVRRAIPKWVRVFDPNLLLCDFNADDSTNREISYRQIQDKGLPNKKLLDLILSLTFTGLMTETIDYAKKNKRRESPDYEHSAYIEKFAYPESPWYHEKFAKDLWTVCHPNWKRRYLTCIEDQKRLLELWFRTHKKEKRTPNIRDTWIIPKGHPLEMYAKFGFKILPTPGSVWKELGTIQQEIFFLEHWIKQGKKPPHYDTFKYNNPKEAEKLEKKYPEILCYQKYIQKNLTKPQQQKVDRWKKVEQLVINDKNDYELIKSMDSKTRMLVGNHLKMLDQKFAFQTPKIQEIIKPIIKKIKERRPVLYKLYCHTKLETKENKLDNWIRGIETEAKQNKLLKLAKQNAPRPRGALSYVLTSYTRKNNLYPEFEKKIKNLRPDWFDNTLLKKAIWKRHHAKKKKFIV